MSELVKEYRDVKRGFNSAARQKGWSVVAAGASAVFAGVMGYDAVQNAAPLFQNPEGAFALIAGAVAAKSGHNAFLYRRAQNSYAEAMETYEKFLSPDQIAPEPSEARSSDNVFALGLIGTKIVMAAFTGTLAGYSFHEYYAGPSAYADMPGVILGAAAILTYMTARLAHGAYSDYTMWRSWSRPDDMSGDMAASSKVSL